VAAAQGLEDLSAEEERSMARAMTGEAVRWAVFLQEIPSAEAGRQDATEFRRHRLPGIRRLGPPLTPLPELRTWLEWQLLGLSPTAAVQEERRGHMRAKPQHKRGAQFAGSYGSQDMEGAMDVEITVAKELEQLPGIQGTAATARERARATAAARQRKAHQRLANTRRKMKQPGRVKTGALAGNLNRTARASRALPQTDTTNAASGRQEATPTETTATTAGATGGAVGTSEKAATYSTTAGTGTEGDSVGKAGAATTPIPHPPAEHGWWALILREGHMRSGWEQRGD
jgi:hypothetical protein